MSKRDRNEAPDELVAVGGAPNWLENYMGPQDESHEGMGEYRVLPRLTIVQSMSDEGIRDEYGDGAVVITEGNVLIAEKGEPFDFTPLLFFKEFIHWRDRREKHSDGPIIDRSFNETGPIALRARDKEQRQEYYDGGPKDKPFEMSWLEHLNFIGVIYAGEFAGTECVASFKRGEFWTGKNYINKIGMRKIGGKAVPLWSTVWTFFSELHTSKTDPNAKWFGYNIRPAEIPTIKADLAQTFFDNHLKLKTDQAEKKLRVDHANDDVTDTGENADDSEL